MSPLNMPPLLMIHPGIHHLILLALHLLHLTSADHILLHHVKNNELEQVREHLTQHGKDPNHMDPWEKSVLMHSCYKGHFDVAELLIKHGADVNSVARSGRTPLIAAAFGGHVKVVKLLLDNGAKLDEQDNRHQFTALHHAMNELRHDHDAEHEAVVRLLIQAGANMHLKASNGKTVEHMADGKRLFHHHLNKHVIKKTAHSRARLDKEKEMKEHNEQKQTASVSDDEKSDRDRDRNAEL